MCCVQHIPVSDVFVFGCRPRDSGIYECRCMHLHVYHSISIYVSGSGLDPGNIKTKPKQTITLLSRDLSSWEPQQKKYVHVCVCV